ncbi:MAG TPA: molybdenum cofactor biosynthesis protein MoaE [Acidimicrobiales bacterium]|nr:molybdenum cofactor biosynthesis protein MoaE [Acidimicrobiales bacterium]
MSVLSLTDWVSVSASPLSQDDLAAWAVRPDCGAVVTFCGTTRCSSTTGHEIRALEYETSEELAEARIAEVVAQARVRWPEIGAVAIHHRVGLVKLGEPAVVVAVSSPHRREAFEAAQFCIDTVKRCVPMWKREIWDGGSAWSEEAQPLVRVDDV